MTDRLHISSVFADEFGGLRKRELALPDNPFVVVVGSNEAGKSSMATLMAWLLVGSYGDPRRFGEPGNTITGELEARLDGALVRAAGSFKINKTGTANDSKSNVTVDGHELTAATWREMHLRGIDAAIMQGVYAMSGVDLHSGEFVHKAIAKLAVGGLAGAGTALDVKDALDERAKQLLSSKAADIRSFKKLHDEANGKEKQLLALEVDVDAYKAICSELGELEQRLAAIPAEHSQLNRLITAHATAIEVLDARGKLYSLEGRLASLAAIDAHWVTVIDRLPELGLAQVEIERLAGAVSEAETALFAAARAVGLDDAEMSVVQVAITDVSSINALFTALSIARQDRNGADDAVAEARSKVDVCAHELETARAACPDLDHDALSAVRVDSDVPALLNSELGRLHAAEEAVRGAKGSVTKAIAERDGVVVAVAQCRERWKAFRPDVSAEQWLANPRQADGPSSPGGPTVDTRVAYALAALVTVGAVMLLSRPIAAAVAVVAIVAAFVLGRSPRPSTMEAVEDPAVREAAEAVAEQTRRLIAADEAVGTAERAVVNAEVARGERSTDVGDLLRAVGIEPAGNSAELGVRFRAVSLARTALDDLTEAQRVLALRESNAATARAGVDKAEGALREALAACGIPAAVEADAAAARIADYHDVSLKRDLLGDLRSRLDGARRDFTDLIAPVAAELEGLTPSATVARVEEAAVLARERSGLEGQIDEQRGAIEERLGSDGTARELVDSDLDAADLASEQERCTLEMAALTEELNTLNTRRGELNLQKAQAEQKDTLSALQMEIGNLEEERDQRLVEGVEALLARAVLAEVAEEVRRRNQPQLVITAEGYVQSVVPEWRELSIEPATDESLDVDVRRADGTTLSVSKLSTGAQAVLYLALRLAAADQDAAKRQGLRFPIICDDPLVHLDDERGAQAATLLRKASANGHQVILFTCNSRTEAMAAAAGAEVLRFG